MERKKPAKSKKSLKNMTKEQLREALQKKKEGNCKALQIVESFTDTVPTEKLFLSKLFDLNQSHYQDIVEERAILNKCGYALCDQTLGSVPSKQYHISTLHNRVFDITERKNFCSNYCFKSSNYIKDQMLTSPLWMRDTEKAPDFKLLSQAVSAKDIAGHEVDLGHIRIKPSDIDKPAEEKDETSLEELLSDIDHAISISDPTQDRDKHAADVKDNSHTGKTNDIATSSDRNEAVKLKDICDKTSDSKEPVRGKAHSSVENKIDVDEQESMEDDESSTNDSVTVSSTKESVTVSSIKDSVTVSSIKDSATVSSTRSEASETLVKEITENEALASDLKDLQDNKRKDNSKLDNMNVLKKSKLATRESTKVKDEKENLNKTLNRILALESNLKQWMSVDTLILLVGETVVQNVLIETNKHYKQHVEVMKQLDATAEPHMSQLLGQHKESYARYSALCRKLNMLELVDEAEDSRLRGEQTKPQPQEPVPHYEELRNRTAEMMIVVQEFYKGEKRKVTFAEETPADNEADAETPPVILPAVDMHAQKALRRKILLDKLVKIVPEVLRLLGASHLSLTSELRNLVRTFNLTAHNVMLQAAEWNLIAVILIKMLSLRDVYLKEILAKEQSRKHLTLICLSYGLDLGYLDRLQDWLLEPNHVIASSMSSSPT